MKLAKKIAKKTPKRFTFSPIFIFLERLLLEQITAGFTHSYTVTPTLTDIHTKTWRRRRKE
jgi:hypothetical protein